MHGCLKVIRMHAVSMPSSSMAWLIISRMHHVRMHVGSCLSCAGIVKDCRLVSGCMHRFCSECIEKWLRVARCDCTPSIAAVAGSRKAWNCKRAVYAGAAGLLAVESTMQLPMTN